MELAGPPPQGRQSLTVANRPTSPVPFTVLGRREPGVKGTLIFLRGSSAFQVTAVSLLALLQARWQLERACGLNGPLFFTQQTLIN